MSDMVVVLGAGLIFTGLLSLVALGAWRSFTPRGVALYFGMWCCMVLTVVCALNSTFPSSAPRRQADGVITWIVTRGGGRSKTYAVGLKLANGSVLPLRASAMPPFFAKDRDIVSVTYLEEWVTNDYPRAIAFRVLTGPRVGFNDSVSADWLGPWMGMVIGPLCGIAAIYGAYRNTRKKPGEPSSGPSIAA